MMKSDDFAEAVNKSMAEVREAMQETAERLEAEFRRLAGAAGMDVPSADRMREGNEQFRELLDSLREETAKAAGQFSDGMNEMLAELRRLLEATMPGWATGGPSDGPAAEVEAAPAEKAAKKATKKKATKKKATKKKAAKKSTTKAAAKKATKKKATKKKATKKKAAKKSTKKAPAKKTAKKSTKKSTKKAAKKAT